MYLASLVKLFFPTFPVLFYPILLAVSSLVFIALGKE